MPAQITPPPGTPSGAPIPGLTIPGAAPNAGNIAYFNKGGTLPTGVTMSGGLPTAKDTSIAGPGDKVVNWPDGHKTILMANGLSVDVPAGGGEGGGEAAKPAPHKMPAPAGANKPTKVIGPKHLKDLLPAFSPAAFNQFPYFYSSDQYVPASQLQGSLKNLGGQQAIADLLGVNWDGGYTLNLPPGGGQQMPQSSLTSSNVDPRVYGYAAPILNQAMYQSARSTAK